MKCYSSGEIINWIDLVGGFILDTTWLREKISLSKASEHIERT